MIDFVQVVAILLFFDEGKCYFFGRMGQLKFVRLMSRPVNSYLRLNACGREMGGRYPEGPHLYKKTDILSAVGGRGTEHGHHVTLAWQSLFRRALPPCPSNPILSHFNNEMQNSPIQGLGHADFVQAPDGSLGDFLGYRTHGYLQHVMGNIL